MDLSLVPQETCFCARFPGEIISEVLKHMETEDLFNIRCTCKMLSELGLDELYTRDSMKKAPRFLLWAVLIATDEEGVDMLRRFEKCMIKKVGVKTVGVNAVFRTKDAYCTALHIAAARDSAPVVKELLEMKADVQAPAYNLESFMIQGLGDSFRIPESFRLMIQDKTSRDSIFQTLWLPLFVPAVAGFSEVRKLLLDNGAPGCLTMPVTKNNRTLLGSSPSSPKPGSLVFTLLHLPMNSMEMYIFGDEFRELANFKCPGSGLTPLHLAVMNGNEHDILGMVVGGCSVYGLDRWGRSPLSRAAEAAATHPLRVYRKKAFKALEGLINSNANVNQRQGGIQGETVLIRLACLVRHHWATRHRDIKKVIEYLIRFGGNVNTLDNFGATMLTTLCRAIKALKGNQSIEAYFFRLISVFGAYTRIHHSWPPGNSSQSLVGMSIDSDCLCRFTHALDQAGQMLQSHEVDRAFDLYARVGH